MRHQKSQLNLATINVGILILDLKQAKHKATCSPASHVIMFLRDWKFAIVTSQRKLMSIVGPELELIV
jgi:hypothetical protein